MSVLAKLGGGISALVVCTYILSMGLIIVLLTSTSIGTDMASHEVHLIFGAFLIPISTPFVVNSLGSFLALFGIFVLCLVAAAKLRGGLAKGLRQVFSNSLRDRLPNWLLVMPLASSALLIVVLVVTIAQEFLGVPTGSIPLPCDVKNIVDGCIPAYRFLYLLAYAPPVEETMFRISTLGLLMALRTTWSNNITSQTQYPTVPSVRTSRTKLVILSFLLPETAKGRVGLPTFERDGWRAIHWTEWLILITTSAGFGIAHFLTNVGWEAGKVLTASLAGLALGLAYLLYGAYASILLHWFFNVYLGAYALSSLMLGGYFLSIEEVIGLLAIAAGVTGIPLGIKWFASTLAKGDETTYRIPNSPTPS